MSAQPCGHGTGFSPRYLLRVGRCEHAGIECEHAGIERQHAGIERDVVRECSGSFTRRSQFIHSEYSVRNPPVHIVDCLEPDRETAPEPEEGDSWVEDGAHARTYRAASARAA